MPAHAEVVVRTPHGDLDGLCAWSPAGSVALRPELAQATEAGLAQAMRRSERLAAGPRFVRAEECLEEAGELARDFAIRNHEVASRAPRRGLPRSVGVPAESQQRDRSGGGVSLGVSDRGDGIQTGAGEIEDGGGRTRPKRFLERGNGPNDPRTMAARGHRRRDL